VRLEQPDQAVPQQEEILGDDNPGQGEFPNFLRTFSRTSALFWCLKC
jgi:hypothetical protein